MNISKEKLKLIGGGIIVMAAASLMLQPLICYIAGLGRMITFVVTALLIGYLIAVVIIRLRGKSSTSSTSGTSSSRSSGGGDDSSNSDKGDLEA